MDIISQSHVLPCPLNTATTALIKHFDDLQLKL